MRSYPKGKKGLHSEYSKVKLLMTSLLSPKLLHNGVWRVQIGVGGGVDIQACSESRVVNWRTCYGTSIMQAVFWRGIDTERSI